MAWANGLALILAALAGVASTVNSLTTRSLRRAVLAQAEASAEKTEAERDSIAVATSERVVSILAAELDRRDLRGEKHRAWDDEVIRDYQELGRPLRPPPPI